MAKGQYTKKAKARELLSVNAFAARLEVDEKTIRNYIAAGKFPNGAVYDEDNVRKMDVEVATDEWLSFGGGADRRTKRKSRTEAEDDDSPDAQKNKKYLTEINEARAKTEHYKAQTAELEYKELSKQLVRREDVYKEIFSKGVALREALLRIPGLVIDKIMTGKDRYANILLMQKAIEDELTRLTDDEINDDDEDEYDAAT